MNVLGPINDGSIFGLIAQIKGQFFILAKDFIFYPISDNRGIEKIQVKLLNYPTTRSVQYQFRVAETGQPVVIGTDRSLQIGVGEPSSLQSPIPVQIWKRPVVFLTGIKYQINSRILVNYDAGFGVASYPPDGFYFVANGWFRQEDCSIVSLSDNLLIDDLSSCGFGDYQDCVAGKHYQYCHQGKECSGQCKSTCSGNNQQCLWNGQEYECVTTLGDLYQNEWWNSGWFLTIVILIIFLLILYAVMALMKPQEYFIDKENVPLN